ncbi:MAG: sugar ABC transporter ATP-binding protein [Planctomycetota bacterium]|nr:sugar ABC transporter ATP-binding protein [Planctomycetota bacterium]
MPTRTPNSSSPRLLRMEGIEKSFPGVRALSGVDLELSNGEVLALVGENGAGKSTLIKVLAGAHRPDSGRVLINGPPADLGSPSRAREAGIGVIHQELNLVPFLSVTENIFLGREITRGGIIDREAERARVRALFDKIGLPMDPTALCHTLSVAERQAVEIAKALVTDARILVMDEPTATLTPREVERLFGIIRDLKDQGIGIIYISHRLDEIRHIADRVMVLRDGGHVGTHTTGDVEPPALIEMMVGRPLEQEFPREQRTKGAVRLAVEGLRRGDKVRGVSFTVSAGEILGITGLVGAGRTETARLIAGADRADAGTISLDGRPLRISGPRSAIQAGICLLTEDRGGQGLALGHPVVENFGLPNLAQFSRWRVLSPGRERAAFGRYERDLKIKTRTPDQPAGTLSGGNQQKVVLAKWLERDCEVIIIDEPTRGVDVGARYEFYALINELAGAGKAIVLISSELPEVLGMADRVLVMGDGRVNGEITDVANATQEQIMELAIPS